MNVKKSVLQNVIQSLKNQLSSAKLEASGARADSAYYKRLADSQVQAINSLSRSHDAQIQSEREHARNSLLSLGQKGEKIILDMQAQHNVNVARAQRDTLGEAFKYLADNLTLNK